ncbi:hypothetical protein Tco_0058522 [Tanacetum coccineum]
MHSYSSPLGLGWCWIEGVLVQRVGSSNFFTSKDLLCLALFFQISIVDNSTPRCLQDEFIRNRHPKDFPFGSLSTEFEISQNRFFSRQVKGRLWSWMELVLALQVKDNQFSEPHTWDHNESGFLLSLSICARFILSTVKAVDDCVNSPTSFPHYRYEA